MCGPSTEGTCVFSDVQTHTPPQDPSTPARRLLTHRPHHQHLKLHKPAHRSQPSAPTHMPSLTAALAVLLFPHSCHSSFMRVAWLDAPTHLHISSALRIDPAMRPKPCLSDWARMPQRFLASPPSHPFLNTAFLLAPAAASAQRQSQTSFHAQPCARHPGYMPLHQLMLAGRVSTSQHAI